MQLHAQAAQPFAPPTLRNGLKIFLTVLPAAHCSQVIDVEIARRKLLEATPIACRNEEVVNFDTAEIPWWAWVKRFHLPEVSSRGTGTQHVSLVTARQNSVCVW
jgi:hypothetical protein